MNYRTLQPTGPATWEWVGDPITQAVLGDPIELERLERAITAELRRAAYAGGRVELIGDFLADAYLKAWLDIARATPAVEFHACSTEDDRMSRIAEPDAPDNFRWTHPDDDQQKAARGQTGGRQ